MRTTSFYGHNKIKNHTKAPDKIITKKIIKNNNLSLYDNLMWLEEFIRWILNILIKHWINLIIWK